MKVALKKLEQRTVKASKDESSVYAKADRYRRRAKAAQLVVAEIHKAEQAKAEMEEIGKKSVGADLGALLRKKGMKATDIINKEFTKPDFAYFCNSIGLNAYRWELDSLFDRLDDDGSGSLDPPEIKAALKQLEEECEQVKVDIRSAGQRSAEVTRQARGVYEKWFEENQAEEKAEKDAAEKEAQRRQAEVDAKIQAQENWKLLQEEKERAIAAEKRAFDEKVKLKRAKSKAQMSSKPESP